jgi:Domain of unknown function (DUF4340)
MNLKTTVTLLGLVAAGAGYWLFSAYAPFLARVPAEAARTDAGTRDFLRDQLTAEKLQGIRIQAGDQEIALERSPGGEWTLPGKWPTRKAGVDGLVQTLCNLHSRFAPFPLEEGANRNDHGTDHPQATVHVRVGGQEYKLAFGEEQEGDNRSSRVTYLRLEDRPELLRLAPGLVAVLERPASYYEQRRLFPSERVAKDDDSQEKVERLAARRLKIREKSNSYELAVVDGDWQLDQPQRDPVDPDKLKSILAAVPDIWAEQFVARPKKDLAEYGLKEPEQTIQVTSQTGSTVTLLVGKQSQVKPRKVMRPAPSMGGPPLPPQTEIVHEEFRFAKLQDNNQIFEVKADKLKDLFVSADSLRDARLARFRTDEARRVEVQSGGADIVLVKDKDQWRLQKPFAVDAESGKITELLDKLSFLEARDKDVLHHVDPKVYGLDKPSITIQVAVDQEVKGQADAKTRKPRTFVFQLGKHDTSKAKLYVRMGDWDRVNAVDDSILKLADRPALAYRSRRVLDLNSTELARIDVHRNSESFSLEQVKGTWQLAKPVHAEIDAARAGQLAGDLGRLEAAEYISQEPAAADLEKQYGLAKPVLSATLTFLDSKKPAQTLLLGNARNGKAEYYAKLASGPAVFVVKKEIHDALNQDSLAYRRLELWQVPEAEIQEVRLLKQGSEYRLTQDAGNWQIAGPFTAAASADLVRPLLTELAAPRCERYVAHSGGDLKKYGLDQPEIRVALQKKVQEKARPKAPSPDPVLLIGKKTDAAGTSRFARLADRDGVFVISDKLASAVNHRALDFLDRNLLSLDSRNLESIQESGADGSLVLQRRGDEWRVEGSPAPSFVADSDTVAAALGLWSNLRAQEFAAYGPKLDLATFGLDHPFRTINVKSKQPPGSNPASTASGHTLFLGKEVPGHPGERYARLDQRPAVVVLAGTVVSELSHNYLDFVNRSLLKLDRSAVRAIERRMGDNVLKLVVRDGQWRVAQPGDLPADGPYLDSLLGQLASLRARRMAAYPTRELKPYELDVPQVQITLQLAESDGKKSQHVIKVGKRTGDSASPEDRFALVDNSMAVVVLPADLASKLTASPLQFRNHDLAQLENVDRAVLLRGPRTATFAKLEGTWRLTQPVESEAEQADLEDLISALSRLRADEFVAEKPDDLKPYGLDHPQIRWQLSSGNKSVLDLHVGKQAQGKDGARAYAQIAGSGLVFLLGPQVTTKVFGEYRSRSIWPPLDAVQINKLTYGYPQQAFALEKVDNEWQISGQPTIKVKQESVRETLDALAGLRAERYLEDQAADPRLYGLEPPQLALHIETSSGSRVLNVGRHEGESGRYYAAVPGTGKPAVFAISEADATRIVRRKEVYIKK